jgi:hypothetical protein
VSDEDELETEESSSFGGVIGGDKGSIRKGVRERRRALLGVADLSERERRDNRGAERLDCGSKMLVLLRRFGDVTVELEEEAPAGDDVTYEDNMS